MSERKGELPPAYDEFLDLIESVVEGTASDGQRSQLESRLRSETDARQVYVAYLDLHAQLQWRTRGRSDRTAISAVPGVPLSQRRPTRRLVWSAVAAIASVAAAIAVYVAISPPHNVPEEAQTPDLPLKPAGAVAVLIENRAAIWEAGTNRPTKSGSYLLPGRLKLKSGVVEIAFSSGGEVLLEGPAEFDVNAKDRGFLHRGKLTAKAKEKGSALIVDLPGAMANIQGECGVVCDANGRAEVHVFAGEVRATPADARGQPLPGGRSLENSAATIDSAEHTLTDLPLNFVAFSQLRPAIWVSDAAVRDGQHSRENFGAVPQLVVKKSVSGYSWETFLRFDLEGVTDSLGEAVIRLVPLYVGQPMQNSAAIVASSENWSEQSITWETKPGSGPAIATWTVADTSPVEFDVTQQVREALASDKRLQLRIFAPNYKRGSAYVQYGSREAEPASRPQLIITPQRMTHKPHTETGNRMAALARRLPFSMNCVSIASISSQEK